MGRRLSTCIASSTRTLPPLLVTGSAGLLTRSLFSEKTRARLETRGPTSKRRASPWPPTVDAMHRPPQREGES